MSSESIPPSDLEGGLCDRTPDALNNEDYPSEEPRNFISMGLAPEILRALSCMGYERPTKVQSAVFDTVAAGKDVLVQSRTGTGKTAAFGIPVAHRLSSDNNSSKALALAPTRELALQVARELENICQHLDIRTVAIYGGAPMKPQVDALQAGARIIAGTPGRVLDHIRRGTLDTQNIEILVLDECDEMLSMGFQEEIDAIVSTLPTKQKRQTLLFSATIPTEIQRIARHHMTDPENLSLSTDGISVDKIDHYYYVVSGARRLRDLLSIIASERPEAAIIFCNTRDDTNSVARFLTRHNYDAEAISSDLSQRDRERVMKRMRAKNLQFLVATDVAARGIDIQDLTHVINYTFPESPQVYVHRTGRTGRAGKRGVAISLVGPREIGAFYYLKLTYKIRPEERNLPTSEELTILQQGQRYQQILQLVPEQPSEESVALARRLWQSLEGERVVGALLERLFQAKPTRNPSANTEQREKKTRAESTDEPLPDKKRRRRRRKRTAPQAGATSSPDSPQDQDSVNPPEKDSQSTPTTSDEDQEFWETWADEKKNNEGSKAQESHPKATTRLYLNVGKRENVTAENIRELLVQTLESDHDRIGSILLRSTHSYVRVPEDLADTIIDNASGKTIGERRLVVERTRSDKPRIGSKRRANRS